MDSSEATSLHPSKQSRFVDWLTANNATFPKLEFRDGKNKKAVASPSLLQCISTFAFLCSFFSIIFLLCIQSPVCVSSSITSISLVANFIFFSSIKDAEGCGSVYASADIAEDEVFLTIPFEPLVITDALARKHLPSSVKELDSRTVIMLFLIQQTSHNQLSNKDENEETGKAKTDLSRTASFYKPYLDMIPDSIHTALAFNEQETERLRGTNAFMAVKERQEDLKAQYEKTIEVVGGNLKVEHGFTWERFLWAATVVSSRTFPASLFGSKALGEIVLIPLAGRALITSHRSKWRRKGCAVELTDISMTFKIV
jgi:hypothetical protein